MVVCCKLYFYSQSVAIDIGHRRVSPLVHSKAPPNTIWWGRCRKSRPVISFKLIFWSARHIFSSDTPDPNLVHRGEQGRRLGAWVTLWPTCKREHRCFIVLTSSPALSNGAEPAAALQQHSEPSCRSTRQRKCHLTFFLPLRALHLCFPTTSDYIMLGASPLRAHILPPPVENASPPHHNLRHAPSAAVAAAPTTTAPPPSPPQDLAPSQADEREDSDDEEFYAGLPTDADAEEADAVQRANPRVVRDMAMRQVGTTVHGCREEGGSRKACRRRQPPAPMLTAATSRWWGLRWWRLSNASPRRTEPGARDGGSRAPATRNQYPLASFDPWAER
jgi:hypothetical protein